jgi:16S rRNA (cytosine967-C5)-methyltransferase
MARSQDTRTRDPVEPLGTATRRASLRLLDAVLRRGEPLETALAGATRALAGGPDRGLAHAIAAETLRQLPDLDALIDGATRQRLPDDAKARFALRIALVQVLALRTPPHAAIATVLPLVDGGPRKLVHGVFGTLMRANATLPEVPTLPADVAERWTSAWGADVAAGAARAFAAPPPLDLTLADIGVGGSVGVDPRGTAVVPDGMSLMPGHLRLADHGPVDLLPGFAEGWWWVQDIAASLPARMFAGACGRIVDVCAAPGGKSLQLAAMGLEVTALDVSATRLERFRQNLKRTGLSAEVVCGDALEWSPPAPVANILVDAPCSATGIFRRHPDVLHRVRPAVIAEMAALQERILARAADWVAPGGTLVFATCSLEPAEGEEQLARFLAARSDYRLELAPGFADALPAGLRGAVRQMHGGAYVRTLPGMLEAEGGCDGFFIARLVRAA